MLKCSSIGEIPTLSKHFHFQNCLWPSLLRSRKSDRISSGGWGNRAPERRPLCVCRERVCWKEWMSGEQGSPKDAVAFINSLAQLYGHLQIYTCNNIPPPLPRTQKPQGVAGKYHSAPAWAERASVPCTGRGRCKLTCPLLIPFVLHTHVLRVRPGCGAQLERGAEDKVRLGRTGKLGGHHGHLGPPFPIFCPMFGGPMALRASICTGPCGQDTGQSFRKTGHSAC